MSVIMTQNPSLRGGLFRPGNDVLFRDWLDPKVRWKVRQVCNERDKWAAGIDVRPAFADLPVEMRNHGNEKVCRMLAPKVFQQTDQRLVKQANRCLQHTKEVGTAQRPAVLQQNVVLLLDAYPGEPAQYVEPVGQVLELNELDLPVALLLGNDRLQGHRSVAMSATAVVENDVHFFHWADSATRLGFPARAHSMPCG